MNHQVLFVLGEPGAGKTTAVRSLLKGAELIPSPKWTVTPTICAAGHYTGAAFDGADTVPYNGARAALLYWREYLLPSRKLTIFDGDRFSCESTLEYLRTFCPTVDVRGVYLTTSLAWRRRQTRAEALGTKQQNEAWVKGRATKARTFACKIPTTTINADIDPDTLGVLLAGYCASLTALGAA